ncbi:MAG: 2-C-methyl-D-erythritol 4-phosphate cytidylyltransferase [Flavobacteriales bacterium]
MKKTVIIVAGGSGTRLGSDIPKQFLKLKGKPILFHTIEKFHNAFHDMEIIVVLPKRQVIYWEELKRKHRFDIPHQIVAGGKSRFESVRNGMSMISEECIVGIHDAVRPLISEKVIKQLFSSAEKNGNAIPFAPCKDSLRKVENNKNKAVPREQYVLIQTPQCFQWSKIRKGYLLEEESQFTDDASVYEFLGGKINLVKGDEYNIKITYPSDLLFAEALLSSKH